jgi:pimeloyl-ACP methyl ester carboxylesterase
MPIAEVNGQQLYYELHGEGEPLLLVHGLSVDTLGWALQLPLFSQRFRTIAFDNRDVGRSTRARSDYEIADMAADTLALADELGLDSFHLLGFSMGGAIAQEVALTAPGRVRTLTLCVTYAGAGAWAREHMAAWSERVLTMTREQRVDELLRYSLKEETYETPDFVTFVRTAILASEHPQEPEAFGRQVSASARHDARGRLGELTMPVHVIGAEHDILLPVWKSQQLAELIPGARFTVLEGAAHGVNIDGAEQFNAAVLDFLGAASTAA